MLISAGTASGVGKLCRRFFGKKVFLKNIKIVLTNDGNMRIINIVVRTKTTKCGCSSSGRAPPCQGGGSEFEPRHPLQSNPIAKAIGFCFVRTRCLHRCRTRILRSSQRCASIPAHRSVAAPLQNTTAPLGCVLGNVSGYLSG